MTQEQYLEFNALVARSLRLSRSRAVLNRAEYERARELHDMLMHHVRAIHPSIFKRGEPPDVIEPSFVPRCAD